MNKRFVSIIFICLLAITCGLSKVSADEEAYNGYTYTIKVDGGHEGYGVVTNSLGEPVSEITGIIPGSMFNPFSLNVVETTEKYKFIGFHVSGQMDADNDVFERIGNKTINEDLNLVATYGFVGDLVEYHVFYKNTIGEDLREMDVFYGYPGDRPVVAYRYIAGYVPNTYSYSGTALPTRESGEILEFTFYYSRLEVDEYELD